MMSKEKEKENSNNSENRNKILNDMVQTTKLVKIKDNTETELNNDIELDDNNTENTEIIE